MTIYEAIAQYLKERVEGLTNFNKRKSSYFYEYEHTVNFEDSDTLDIIKYIYENEISDRDQDIIYSKLKVGCTFNYIALWSGMNVDYVGNKFRSSMYKIYNRLVNIKAGDSYGEIKCKNAISRKDISTRLYNILNRMNINTFDEVLGITHDEFIKQRNAGEKTWEELLEYKKIMSELAGMNEGI